SGEPYLRVGPFGTFENRRSPTLYQNKVPPTGHIAAPIPAEANASAPPQWVKTSSGHTVTWRDQRTRWEGPAPNVVTDAPGKSHIIVPFWYIQLKWNNAVVNVAGRITYEPPPKAWPWLVASLVLLVVVALLGRWTRWGVALSVALAVLVAIDVVRSF